MGNKRIIRLFGTSREDLVNQATPYIRSGQYTQFSGVENKKEGVFKMVLKFIGKALVFLAICALFVFLSQS